MRLPRQLSASTEKTEGNSVFDDCDRRILGALTENSRISYRKLAKVANLSANATAERVHRLQTAGIILGFSVEISPASLGLSLQAFIDVKLQHGTSMVTGSFDARLRVDCKNPTQLGSLIEQLRKHTGVLETRSTVICRELQIRSDGRGPGLSDTPSS